MKRGLLLLAWLLSHASTVLSQQLLCERELRINTPGSIQAVTLLRLQPDSLRLVSDNIFPLGIRALRTRVQRLNVNGCDTLPAGPAVVRVNNSLVIASTACTNRRGQVLVAVQATGGRTPTNGDSVRFRLQLFNRDGTTRWLRAIRPQTANEGVNSLIEAPGNGFYAVGFQTNGLGNDDAFLLRLDSLGNVQWRRVYRRRGSFYYYNPVYTRTGTLLMSLFYVEPPFAFATGVTEFSQQGDSLTTRRVLVDPQQTTSPMRTSNSLLPLRDGGYALVGQVDSANTGHLRPFLVRLDRNLTLTWSYVYRPQATQYLRFAQPQELADGSLVVVASNTQSGRGSPFWLFRFAATGALQQRYPFVSQVLTAYNTAGRYGYFGLAQGLQPLSDSSFVAAAGYAEPGGGSSRVYLAHLRVPGLPRVIDSHYVPAAQPLATRTGRAAGAALELFPNPASETLTVRYPPPAGHAPATLVLYDVLGRAVLTLPLGATAAEATVSVRGLPAGLYQATVRAAGQAVAAGKLAITR